MDDIGVIDSAALRGMFYWKTVVVAALGLAVCAASFVAVYALESKLVRETFARKAEDRATGIKLAVDRAIAAAHSSGALFDSDPAVSRRQFRTFTLQIIKDNQGLEGVMWIPRVPATARTSFEKARQGDVPGFRFWEFGPGGQRIAAREQSEYFPVDFVEGMEGSSSTLGLIINRNPLRATVLAYAADTAAIASTEKIVGVVKNAGSHSAVLLFRPVYTAGVTPQTVDERRARLEGFAASVIFVETLIASVLDRFEREPIQAAVFDAIAAAEQKLLGTWPAQARGEPAPEEGALRAGRLHHEVRFAVGGRDWSVILTPVGEGFGTGPSWRAWGSLALGLMLTALLIVYLEAARRQTERIRQQSITDSLTGLYNRRYLWDFLQRDFARARRNDSPLAAIMLDIDHFKSVNDMLGHEGGDVALRALGALLKDGVRGSDLACRYGGEEFVLILPDATADSARRRAEQIRLAVQHMPLAYKGKPVRLTISMGVAAFPENAPDSDSLLRRADEALYEAKRTGRDRVVVAGQRAAPVGADEAVPVSGTARLSPETDAFRRPPDANAS
jgi:diguanylate cyclase (GGDEF)-like protein